ncbi:AI-2E family transporter [Algicella marina]|uniref:AI-2E family transporter n=1 Tax=Algicella marina TaxID=2683284 RepID=A0A6P1SYM0_9RHOB|nr:AI-2E family transporter [Algicella marina]QHQ35568.1 AI-2E family transporter [Algicella marina]
MGMNTQQQLRYWGIAAVVFLLFMWVMGQAILPFLLGAAIAYFLDPVADWMERHGISRLAATALITAGVVLLFAAILFFAIPLVAGQIRDLASEVPDYISTLQTFLSQRFPGFLEEGSIIRRGLVSMQDTIKNGGVAVAEGILNSSLVLIDIVIILVVAPVVSFYMLLDWDRMTARVDDLIPREHLETVRDLAGKVDKVLSGFVRGQLSVCAVLGIFYAVALALVGLKFGVFVGLFAGLVSFIPFVGSITGGILSIGLAVVQFWNDPIWIAAVAIIFVVGQFFEGNVLTPNMVGGSIGLHPVWLMFALSAFGSLFGFPGLLVAVPTAAVLGVLLRFAIDEYKKGRLYQGTVQRPDAAE